MVTRRTLLASVSAVGVGACFFGSLPGLRAVAQTALPLRRSLGEMDLDDPILDTLREFVRNMKDPSRNNQPVSWVSFANIHGSIPGGFNLCPHRNWNFLPWHRAYIQMYEVAARELTGNSDFAMPYWDWTVDRQLPRAFAEPNWNGQPNPLFVPGRGMSATDTLPDAIVGQQEVMDGIYAETNFESFGSSRAPGQDSSDPSWIQRTGTQGTLEATPHNSIHCIVAGPFMCSGASPQDPIFQMHHGNIDRVWAVWNSLGRNNTTDKFWLDTAYSDNFIDPQGNQYSMLVSDLQETPPLGYTYGLEEPDAPPIPEEDDRTQYLAALYGAQDAKTFRGLSSIKAAIKGVAEPLRPLDIPLVPKQEAIEQAAKTPIRSLALATEPREPQVYAIIRNLKPTNPDRTQLRIFVNCDYLSQAVPTTDPHYVTTIGFFGSGAHGQQHGSSVVVNLTGALRRLERAKRLKSDEIVVQLLPAPQVGAELGEAGNIESGETSEIELAIA